MTQQDRWHADTVALRQYATGTATDAVGWSVETHLTGCIVCRARLAHLFTDADRSELSRLRCELSVADGLAQSPASPRAALRGVLGPWWAWIGLVVTAFTAVTLLGVIPTPQSGLLTSWAHVLAPLVPLGMVAVVYALADRDPAAAGRPGFFRDSRCAPGRSPSVPRWGSSVPVSG